MASPAVKAEPADGEVTEGDYRDRASEMLEGIVETIRLIHGPADREAACVLTLLEQSVEAVDTIVCERWKVAGDQCDEA